MGAPLHFIILPLRILRKLVWPIIWHFVYFFLWRPRMTSFLLAGMLIFLFMLFMSSDDDVVDMLPAAITTQHIEPLDAPRQVLTELPPITVEIEDGNSAFTKNLVHYFDLPEMDAYSHEFQYAMGKLKRGEEHIWKYGDYMFGKLVVGPRVDAAGTRKCRPFKEIVYYKGRAQRISGMSCQRASGNGWCKLRKNSARTCEIKRPHGMKGFFFDTRIKLRDWFN